MRAQFVRGIDPKDSMNIGNKHAREAQKLIAVFKEIDPRLDPKVTDDKTTETFESVVVTIKLFENIYALAWINSGIEYYFVSWRKTQYKKAKEGEQETFPKLEQAKQRLKKYMGL
jgi:hypothetical protein